MVLAANVLVSSPKAQRPDYPNQRFGKQNQSPRHRPQVGARPSEPIVEAREKKSNYHKELSFPHQTFLFADFSLVCSLRSISLGSCL